MMCQKHQRNLTNSYLNSLNEIFFAIMQFIGYKYQLAKLIKKVLYNFLIEHQLVCWPTALLPKYLLARFINILLFDILYVIDFSCKMPTSTYCKLELNCVR